MKRLITALLALAVMLSLCACAEPYDEEAVERVQEQVDWLVENTDLDSIEVVEDADPWIREELAANKWYRNWISANRDYSSLTEEEQADIEDAWILDIDPDTYFAD